MIYISENIGKPDQKTIEQIQREIRHQDRVGVTGGGKPGEVINKGRKGQAHGMRTVLRDLGRENRG